MTSVPKGPISVQNQNWRIFPAILFVSQVLSIFSKNKKTYSPWWNPKIWYLNLYPMWTKCDIFFMLPYACIPGNDVSLYIGWIGMDKLVASDFTWFLFLVVVSCLFPPISSWWIPLIKIPQEQFCTLSPNMHVFAHIFLNCWTASKLWGMCKYWHFWHYGSMGGESIYILCCKLNRFFFHSSGMPLSMWSLQD